MGPSPFALIVLLLYGVVIVGVVYFAVRVLQALSSIQRSAEDIANSLRSPKPEGK